MYWLSQLPHFYGGEIRSLWYFCRLELQIFFFWWVKGQSQIIWHVSFFMKLPVLLCGYSCATLSLRWGAKSSIHPTLIISPKGILSYGCILYSIRANYVLPVLILFMWLCMLSLQEKKVIYMGNMRKGLSLWFGYSPALWKRESPNNSV